MFKRKDSTKTQNLRRLLEMQGEDKEKIDAIIALTKENEKKDDKKILQSWISLCGSTQMPYRF
jgi:hypothetical protein